MMNRKLIYPIILIFFGCTEGHLSEKKPKGEDEVLLYMSKRLKKLNDDNNIAYTIDGRRCTSLKLDLVHRYEDLPDTVLWDLASLKYLYNGLSISSKSTKIPDVRLAQDCQFFMFSVLGIDTLNFNKNLSIFNKVLILKVFKGDTSKALVCQVDPDNNVEDLSLGMIKIEKLNDVLKLFPKLKFVSLVACNVKDIKSFRATRKLKMDFVEMPNVDIDLVKRNNPLLQIK